MMLINPWQESLNSPDNLMSHRLAQLASKQSKLKLHLAIIPPGLPLNPIKVCPLTFLSLVKPLIMLLTEGSIMKASMARLAGFWSRITSLV